MSLVPDPMHRWTRRTFLASSLPWLAACTTPLPLTSRSASDPDAQRVLDACAAAHGLAAYRGIHDIAVAYDGQWRTLVQRIQPELVDPHYRGRSEERLLPHDGIVAQRYTGEAGTKQVAWRRGTDDLGRVAVWRNDVPDRDETALRAASLVADAYGMFLLGPLWTIDRVATVRLDGASVVDDRACDVVDVWLEPGLGSSHLDRVAFHVDRSDRLVRRVRFTLEGTANTKGAVAQVDCFDHVTKHGLVVATRYHEDVVHPLRLAAHDWRITGFAVDRGFTADDVTGPSFAGAAARPATPL